MFNMRLWSGRGEKNSAAVTTDQELLTIASPFPPLEPQKVQPFRGLLTDEVGGGANMGVDGSVTNVDFCINADQNNDRYITTLSFLVGYGTSGQGNEWADGGGLGNGSRLFYTSERGEVDIHDRIRYNQDMFRLQFGAFTNAWEVRHINATNDYGYFITMDLTKLGLPFGIKLDRGSNQKLVMTIKDNATNADAFNCICYGFDRFE